MAAATIDQWDADPWLLNTLDDVVDLRTGCAIRTHRADDYMTKAITFAVGPAATVRASSPSSIGITEMATPRRYPTFSAYSGYALTGDADLGEHALFFAYGPGANGKSVLLSTVCRDFGRISPHRADRDLCRQQRRSSPDRPGGLRGARLVTATGN